MSHRNRVELEDVAKVNTIHFNLASEFKRLVSLAGGHVPIVTYTSPGLGSCNRLLLLCIVGLLQG